MPPPLPDHDPDLEDILEDMSLHEEEDGPPDEVMMLKRAKTARGREKQLEKELPWSLIPPEQHENFKAAEHKQYQEHLDYRRGTGSFSLDSRIETKPTQSDARIQDCPGSIKRGL